MKTSLAPKDYTLNNIDFRIASSKSMERFKSIQNFVLTEMKYGQYEFSRTSREIAILYMDLVCRALMNIEDFFVRGKEKELTPEVGAKIVSLLLSRMGYLTEVTRLHKDIFDPRYIEIWSRVHFPITKMIERTIEQSVNMPLDKAFTLLVSTLIDSSDSIRFELYEIDHMLNNDTAPFLVVTDICILSSILMKENGVIARAKAYERFFKKKLSFTLKDYTNSISTFEACKKEIAESGVNIVNKEDL